MQASVPASVLVAVLLAQRTSTFATVALQAAGRVQGPPGRKASAAERTLLAQRPVLASVLTSLQTCMLLALGRVLAWARECKLLAPVPGLVLPQCRLPVPALELAPPLKMWLVLLCSLALPQKTLPVMPPLALLRSMSSLVLVLAPVLGQPLNTLVLQLNQM